MRLQRLWATAGAVSRNVFRANSGIAIEELQRAICRRRFALSWQALSYSVKRFSADSKSLRACLSFSRQLVRLSRLASQSARTDLAFSGSKLARAELSACDAASRAF